MDFNKLKSMGEQAMNSGKATDSTPSEGGMDFGKLAAMGQKAMGGSDKATGSASSEGGMDFGKMAQEAMGSAKQTTTTTASAATTTISDGATTVAAGTQDYGDKAFAFVASKTGKTFDPATQEKITDAARGAFEKATGKKVDPKYSN